ncbi:MAG TPA: M48 family metallopeptidase [Chitinispirillaceae bacterium]|nr:M48 family metallopeptidase [Chitinispirillaceae bacterium]
MIKCWVILPLLLIVTLSCQKVPLTKRNQLSLVSTSQLDSMAGSDYRKFLDSAKVIQGTTEAEMVQRVGERIACAVGWYFNEHNQNQKLKNYKWEFNLVQDTVANAWAMPGGRVAVYSGILPIAENETGLAVVMAHEVSHVVANHGEERLSQALLVQLGGITLAEALHKKPEFTRQLFMAAYGVGATVGVLLPYSRLHESEADRLGLIFMSMAGFDPHAAIGFWSRMMKEQNAPSPPEFLSTHPGNEQRLENIEKLIPEAMRYLNKAKCPQ